MSRPLRFDLDAFAQVTGLHPALVRQLVDLGLVEAILTPSGDLSFTPDQVPVTARLRRLRAGFALNYAALGLVAQLLDRIAELEATARTNRTPRLGGTTWT